MKDAKVFQQSDDQRTLFCHMMRHVTYLGTSKTIYTLVNAVPALM